jgi:type II secretory pathway pseudopilin PulG
MKPITKQSGKKAAFTIIELLTVMSIIIILIGLLVPSLNMVKRYAKEVRQKAQFHSIDSALELFNGEWGGYPPSGALDENNKSYCGATKLCEAMVGQDLAGFHPESHFRADCTRDGTYKLYSNNQPGAPLDPNATANLKARKTYLQNAEAYRLWQLYGKDSTKNLYQELYVLCDVYNRVKNVTTGKGVGMPVLYYKANTLNTKHDPNTSSLPTITDDKSQIYNYLDNDELVHLGPAGVAHPLDGTGTNFYAATYGLKDKNVSIDSGRPHRPDSYILISAGFDGMYGTDDDIFNF